MDRVCLKYKRKYKRTYTVGSASLPKAYTFESCHHLKRKKKTYLGELWFREFVGTSNSDLHGA